MENNNKRKFPAYMIPLLAMPLIASVGLLINTKSSGRYPHQTGMIRTEAEQRDLRLECLEDRIDDLGMNYKSLMEVAGLERTLPVEYDNWKVSVDVNDNWFNRGHQTALDFSEDGLGRTVQVDLSEQDSYDIIEKYRKLSHDK